MSAAAIPLSKRVRPGSEAASWVHTEIMRMEALQAELAWMLSRLAGFASTYAPTSAMCAGGTVLVADARVLVCRANNNTAPAALHALKAIVDAADSPEAGGGEIFFAEAVSRPINNARAIVAAGSFA